MFGEGNQEEFDSNSDKYWANGNKYVAISSAVIFGSGVAIDLANTYAGLNLDPLQKDLLSDVGSTYMLAGGAFFILSSVNYAIFSFLDSRHKEIRECMQILEKQLKSIHDLEKILNKSDTQK